MCEERALYNTINIGDNDTLWIEAIGEIVGYVKKINEKYQYSSDCYNRQG